MYCANFLFSGSSAGPGRAFSVLSPRRVPTPPGPERAVMNVLFDEPFNELTVLLERVLLESVRYRGMLGPRPGLEVRLRLVASC